jgi:hypothetical protein
MDDCIGRLVANTGVDRTAAEKAVGIILQFPLEEGPAECGHALVGCIGVGTVLMAAGPSMEQIHAVTREQLVLHVEYQGKTQSATSSARFPASASSSDA